MARTEPALETPSDMVAISHPDQPGFVKHVARRSLPSRLGAGWKEASKKDVEAAEPAPADPAGADLVAIEHPDNPGFVKTVTRRAFAARAEAGWRESKSPGAKALVETATDTTAQETQP